ncbi:nuclear transport factor 2 family protein [Craurococcus roseus]|uniref:Nuclear transport factor 2 family protein n=1 Tax=Craurococcus roseus TaxID=77585 RepID=A0ABN1ESW3_9PROT
MGLQRRRATVAGAAATLLAAAGNPGPSAEDSAAVGQAVDALTKAMIEADRPRLESLTADRLSYGHWSGRVENRKEFVDNLVSRASAFRRIESNDQTVSLAGDEAIVRHLFAGEAVNPAGQVTPVRIGVSQVWQKQGGGWKLLARQAYRL